MKLEYITAIIRHAVSAVGGILVGQGLADEAAIKEISGGAIAAAALLWSILHKKSNIEGDGQ